MRTINISQQTMLYIVCGKLSILHATSSLTNPREIRNESFTKMLSLSGRILYAHVRTTVITIPIL